MRKVHTRPSGRKKGMYPESNTLPKQKPRPLRARFLISQTGPQGTAIGHLFQLLWRGDFPAPDLHRINKMIYTDSLT